MIYTTGLLLSTMVAICTVTAQQVPQSCPEPQPITNFNASKFEGVWFTQLRTIRGMDSECEQIKYKLKTPSKLHFSGFSLLRASEIVTPILGCAKVQHNTGRLRFKLNHQGHDKNISVHYDVRVIATNYDKFAVLWTCRDAASHLVVYTRELEPSNDVLKDVVQALKDHNLGDMELLKVPQKDCPEYKFFIGDQRDSSGNATRMGPMFINRNRRNTTPSPFSSIY